MTKFWARLLALGLAVGLVGCGKNSLPPEELDGARDALQIALAAWKKGDQSDSLKKRSIEVTDPDWKAGVRLVDYMIYETEGRQGETIRCGALLTVLDAQGKKVNREVFYQIEGTDKILISRAPAR